MKAHGKEQGTRLTKAKALRPRVRLNFPVAFISYCTTKKIKWLIFLLGAIDIVCTQFLGLF